MPTTNTKRIYFHEQGYIDFCEVPAPIYAQGIILGITHPLPKTSNFLLMDVLPDIPSNYVRAARFSIEKRMYYLDMRHSGYLRSGITIFELPEEKVARRVPMLRGRLNQRRLDHFHQYSESSEESEWQHAALVLGFADYLLWLDRQIKVYGRWDYSFEHWIHTMAQDSVKSTLYHSISNGDLWWMYQSRDYITVEAEH